MLVLVCYLLFRQLPKVHQYGSAPVVFVKVVTSLIAAAITFGVLRSYGKFKGEQFGKSVEFGGAAALFLVILLLSWGFEYISRGSIPPILPEFTHAAEISLATGPSFLTVTPDSKNIYALSTENMEISIVNIGSQKLEENIKLRIKPSFAVFDRDARYAFIGGTSSGYHNRGIILKLDTTTKDIIGELEIGKDVFAIGGTISLDGKQLYVSNTNEPFLTVVDTMTLQIIRKIRLDIDEGGGFGLAITPDGSKIYITHGFSKSISVIDTESNTVVSVIRNVGNRPVAITINGDGTKAYVVNNGESSVSIINLLKLEIIKKVDLGNNLRINEKESWPFAYIYITRDDKYMIVWNFHLPYISIVDLRTLTERSVVQISNKISSVAMDIPRNILVYNDIVDNKLMVMYRKSNTWDRP
jgi:YVTN family beta-propeller protein